MKTKPAYLKSTEFKGEKVKILTDGFDLMEEDGQEEIKEDG